MKPIALIFTFSLCLMSAYAQAKDTLHRDATHLIDVWLEGQKDYESMPSISGAIVKDQSVLWSGAFGESNKENAQQSSVNTLGSVCSISKVFTATAVMKLVDERKLRLDDKISQLLPELTYTQAFSEGGEVTVRSLLNHSSGLPRDTEHAYWSPPSHHFPSEQELYASLSKSATSHPVGGSNGYSNVGYALLGQIIEKVTGKTYKQYLESELFAPLNMEDSVVELPKDQIGKNHAVGYTAKYRNGKRNPASSYQTRAMQSAAGVSTTVMDLSKFAKWQFRLAASDKKELLTRASLLNMYESHSRNKRRGNRGLGYQVNTDESGDRWVSHGGICPGFVSFMKMNVTKKMAYFIMVNANKVRAADYINGLIEIVRRADSIGGEPNSSNEVDLHEYTGFYDLTPWNSEYYVAKWGGDLMLLYFPAESLKYTLYRYKHVARDVFKLIQNGEVSETEITFIRNEKGDVVSVKSDGNNNRKIRSH